MDEQAPDERLGRLFSNAVDPGAPPYNDDEQAVHDGAAARYYSVRVLALRATMLLVWAGVVAFAIFRFFNDKTTEAFYGTFLRNNPEAFAAVVALGTTVLLSIVIVPTYALVKARLEDRQWFVARDAVAAARTSRLAAPDET